MATVPNPNQAVSPCKDHVQRRCATRIGVLRDMGQLTVVEMDGQTGVLLDLSASGAAIQTVYPWEAGHTACLQFRIPGSGEAFEIKTQVVWADRSCQTGVRFLDLEENQKQSLRKWLSTQADSVPDSNANSVFLSQPMGSCTDIGPVTLGDEISASLASGTETVMVSREETSGAATDVSALQQEIMMWADLPRDAVLSRFAELARSLTGASGAAIAIKLSDVVVCGASTGDAPPVGSEMASGSSLTGECFRTGQVVLCNDATQDSRVDRSVAETLNLRSVLIAPVHLEDSMWGVLEVLSSEQGAFGAIHVGVLQEIANILASFFTPSLALSNAPAASTTEVDAETASATAVGTDAAVPEFPHRDVDSFTSAARSVEQHATPIVAAEIARKHKLKLEIAVVVAMAILLGVAWTIMVKAPPSRSQNDAAVRIDRPEDQRAPQLSSYEEPKEPAERPELAKGSRPAPQARKPHAVAMTTRVTGTERHKLPPTTIPGAIIEPVSPPSLPSSNANERKAVSSFLAPPASTQPTLAAPVSHFVKGRPISQPRPLLPDIVRRGGMRGSVTLRGAIGVDGRIKRLQVIEGNPLLTGAAVDAVKTWRYEPSYLDGVPVEVQTVITVHFDSAR